MTVAAAGTATQAAMGPCKATSGCEYGPLMSEMFHDLSQPLSTSTCILEVNLMLPRSLKQLRHDLKIILQQVRSMVRLFRSLRELWEAGNAPQDRQVFSLAGCLREVLLDLQPLAESTGVKLSLSSSSDCLVNFHTSVLRRALFHLLEFALISSAAGADVKVTAAEAGGLLRVGVAISAVGQTSVPAGSDAEAAEWKQRDLRRRLGLAIARRVFETADGVLHADDSGERLRLEVRLPAVSLSK